MKLENNPFVNNESTVTNEEQVLVYWKENEVEKKLQEKLSKSKKVFSFIDGPPNSNAPFGVHTSRSLFYKDLILRFKAMQRYNQRRQQGFDCQGLPMELAVRKKLGLKDDDSVVKYGVEKFIKECHKFVEGFAEMNEKTTKRLGNWMHWEPYYLTKRNHYMETEWAFLKMCDEKGWLYRGDYVVPWCPDCRTSLSSHEVSEAQGAYRDVTDPSLYFVLKIKGKDEYLLVWTTTPWTLTANVAVVVNPKLNYVKVESRGNIFYVVKEKLNLLDKPKVLKEMKGKELEGIEYEPLYNNEGVFKVGLADYVTVEDGTGLVHTAPGHGPDDYAI